ncbi:hypothetical protein FB45DRAFT_1059017 [Roridomyces roridus]|uniref:Uncharacterized protein n=1 Tax=Roridomyces roridus TaxID=1738132 RepID=A0AAD7FLI2_9AGAR|nr:hypothetical protein FB45DRAFT_1059017 [Roridomyces roridus]
MVARRHGHFIPPPSTPSSRRRSSDEVTQGRPSTRSRNCGTYHFRLDSCGLGIGAPPPTFMASLAPALAPPPVVGPLPTGFGLGPGREVTEPTMATSRLSCPLSPLPVGLSPCSSRRLNVVLIHRHLSPPAPPSPSTRRRPTSSTPARSPGPGRDGCRTQDSVCRRRRQRRDSFAQNHHHHSKTDRTTTRRPRYGRQGRLGCRTPRYVADTDSARRWCGGWSHFRLGRRLAGQLSDWSCVGVVCPPVLVNAHLAGLVSSTTYPSPPIGNHHPSRLRPPGITSSRYPRPHGNTQSLTIQPTLLSIFWRFRLGLATLVGWGRRLVRRTVVLFALEVVWGRKYRELYGGGK